MALVTIRILDGPERGSAFHQIGLPLTVGREDGNVIQLNDERVSRFHLKIHENEGTILLTDLQSTNGTRVNGEVVQVWQLRPGDVIAVGRSVMIFGSTEEIARRLAQLSQQEDSGAVPMGLEGDEFQFLQQRSSDGRDRKTTGSSPFEMEIFRGLSPEELAPLHLLSPPKLPKGLSPVQTAQMTEFLQYIHLRLRYLVASVRQEGDATSDDNTQQLSVSEAQWQNIVDLYGRIAIALHSVTEP